MNVYDFDHTVYAGDGTVDFYLYCLRKRPGILRALPRQLGGFGRFALGKVSRVDMKEAFYAFLPHARVDDELLTAFWDAHEHKLMPWYLAQKQPEDVIISASPQFLLEPICRRLGAKPPIASLVDAATGKCLGENCRGEEKVRRFHALYPRLRPERFYSDSLSDASMAELAQESWLIKNGEPQAWLHTENNKRGLGV